MKKRNDCFARNCRSRACCSANGGRGWSVCWQRRIFSLLFSLACRYFRRPQSSLGAARDLPRSVVAEKGDVLADLLPLLLNDALRYPHQVPDFLRAETGDWVVRVTRVRQWRCSQTGGLTTTCNSRNTLDENDSLDPPAHLAHGGRRDTASDVHKPTLSTSAALARPSCITISSKHLRAPLFHGRTPQK